MVGLNIKLAMLSTAVVMYTCHPITGSNPLHPLILVPGNGGNQLEARLTAEYKPTSLFCTRRHPARKDEDGWFRLWFDLSVLLAPYTQCFAHRMTLHYDAVLDDYRNTPGVETRVPHFGSTESLLYLNPRLKKITTYMDSLVKSLEQIGYIDGKTLFGAPYDFRYGLAAEGHPCHVGSKLLQDLKILIEKASTSNEGKPVILVSHSLGGLFVLQLLNRNSPSWRRKYIKHFVALSAPWGGTVEEMLTLLHQGTGVKTPETLFYGEGGFDKQPEVVFGDGDGSVNMASLVAIESEWAEEKNQTLKFIRVPGVSHTDILKDDDALGEIIGEICSINSQLVKIDFRMNSFTNEMII
ncbi:alpha/beta-Hydrolases superfamily protein [Actinidia rufa]|uniref:Alpha/beta-Hydrolases superfamily protein n=1 Tax=Actinidia rufa TaxID=165716 RepID=A0A7J0GH96_9ERIC|nr:alpha/beta-Hydrolases superfamily protein [Actinidia rufa]